MAVQLQLRRGTTSQNNSFTGAIGELSYDTSLNQVRIHDSVTAGGKILQDTSNLVTTLTSANTDSQYASAKCLYDNFVTKQDTLVSGSNIKTVNNQSLLGSGNLTLESPAVWGGITGDITESAALMAQLNAKATNAYVVHLTGSETITGTKTFTNAIQQKNVSATKGTTPSSAVYWGLAFNDSTSDASGTTWQGTRLGVLEAALTADNKTSIYISAFKNEANATSNAMLKATYDTANDKAYTYAVTPDVSSNSTEIATTAWIRTLLSTIYPVGSLYIGTQSTCPMATLISGSTWSLVSSGNALWTGTGSNANTTIAAGLPNITGAITGQHTRSYLSGSYTDTSALYRGSNSSGYTGNYSEATSGPGLYFDASRCNSIYGNSTTVQPPAYVVNVWRRES